MPMTSVMVLWQTIRDVFAGSGLTPEERNDPAVQAPLRETLAQSMRFSIVASPSSLLLFAGILWLAADVAFSVVALWVVACLTFLFGAHYRTFAPDADVNAPMWLRKVLFGQATGGLMWGLLPLVAMPEVPVWRAFLGALMLSVLAATTVFCSSVRSAFWAFVAPFIVLVAFGFWLNGGEIGLTYAGVFLYSVPFAAGLRRINCNGHERAAALALRNARLVDTLHEEQELLRLANQKLSFRADHDSLTGLLNRLGGLNRLEEALAAQLPEETTGLLFLDLDNFKVVNDSLGHGAGDELLKAVGGRVSTVLPKSASLARLGGDELTVVLPHLLCASEATEVAKSIRELFDEPFRVAGREIQAGISIGVATGNDDESGEDLLRFADVALYKAKENGRNRVEVFDSDLRASVDSRADDELELRSALRTGQIVAYVQPFVSLDTGAIVGGEALARWHHPDGLRVAGQFIELAEQANLVGDISLAVLEQITDSRIRSEVLANCAISVNVPPAAIARVMPSARSASGMLKGLLLEITENGTISDLDEAKELLSRARDAGAQIMFDDLGVGDSPLSLLTELPLDGIKIDRDFVWKIETSVAARSVVSAIVELARGMELWVVAEGVETGEQASLLRELGVRAAQGFLYSPAVPLAEFEAMVADEIPFPVVSVESRPAA